MMKPGAQALPHLLPLRRPAAEEAVEEIVHLGVAEGRLLLDLDHLPGRDVHDRRHLLFDERRKRFRRCGGEGQERYKEQNENNERAARAGDLMKASSIRTVQTTFIDITLI